MKITEYYPDMLSVGNCLEWADRVGLKWETSGWETSRTDTVIYIPGDNKKELRICLIYDDDNNDFHFINLMNRLRRWKESNAPK